MTNNLLIELACEELPPKALKTLGQAFLDNVVKGLEQNRFSFENARWFATPRRLALHISALADKQTDVEIVKKGPPVANAYDASGAPTRAALGWAKSNNIALEDASVVETPKGQWLQVTVQEKGKNIDSCLQIIITDALAKLPVPKVMRWGNTDHQFVRPVHNLCCLYGDKVLPLQAYGKQANDQVLGHRFHSPGLHSIANADVYESHLESLFVIVNFEQRKQAIVQGLTAQADALNAQVVQDDDLVDEVTSLVEFPVVLGAEFDDAFLEVPKEPLIYTMKDDQRYFPLLSKSDGKLLNQFLFVTNIQSVNPQSVISGNQKVVRPRLADAQFFYKHDLSVKTETRLNSLKSIVYQKQLGTLYDKSERVAKLSEFLSEALQLGDPQLCFRAGLLAKSDLTSKVVYEFPDVQGYMGRYYAIKEGENELVANAIADHYKPRSASDTLPQCQIAQVVSIAERLDTLVGIFGIGLLPKGDKDPFALRRATLGIIKIVLDNDIAFDLDRFAQLSSSLFQDDMLTNNDWAEQLNQFFMARLENYFIEQGAPVNRVRSVIKASNSAIETIKYRLEALTNFIDNNTETLAVLTESNKRIANILAKNPIDDTTVDTALFADKEEGLLWDVYSQVRETTENDASDADYYTTRLSQLAKLRQPIADFFENVMVNADDDAVRANRFAIISAIRNEFLAIADFSILQG
ncbi:glycine--tRNA ligase subunit beta [Planctobacterium marinum]|uniref:glycine--tRNA ligase subunit beta n=1 Tax=Planctobacterium marinum TaxID=1631968 RepID=UPI001E5676C6|nr:glycine--tRNA ligase subunit beta [Planctobacterium marinum]MCC2607220.1 glycine--tRNA ligase subunit beta [Planctobacterium marinum]